MDHDTLADALAAIVRAELAAAPRFDPVPNIDLAVAIFPPGAAPVFANVLFSRDWPGGLVAHLGDDAGPVRNVAYFADPTDAERDSIAWAPGADALRLTALRPLAGPGPHQFIAPYPASLIKLMVAVGVAHLADSGSAGWKEPWTHAGHTRSVAAWAETMLVVSDNDATRALVALLHARGLIVRTAAPVASAARPDTPIGVPPGPTVGIDEGPAPERNALHTLFEQRSLHTLRLAHTRPDGGWLNRDGAGVGRLQMTAWDTLRLLWLLRPDLPAPWLAPGTAALLSDDSCRRLWAWLDAQALHHVLSSTLLAGVPGWQAGIPARLPERWRDDRGGALVDGHRYPPDLGGAQAAATVRFAHKTGNTASYASDAGWVEALQPGGRRYLVAVLTTLGERHAPHPEAATPWCVPRIGAAIDAWIAARWA